MRSLYTDDHEAFRESFSTFVQKELAPHYLDWEEAGIAPREIFASAGQYGFVGMAVPEQYGGGGTNDFRFNAVICEELAAAGISGAGLGLTLHNDITTPYFIEYCNDEQAKRWLPGIAAGTLITAIAMTEPGTGSDLASIGTTAVRALESAAARTSAKRREDLSVMKAMSAPAPIDDVKMHCASVADGFVSLGFGFAASGA